jgi:pSer/pThr/pTyr-binding forkhead associated (FHA) protein
MLAEEGVQVLASPIAADSERSSAAARPAAEVMPTRSGELALVVTDGEAPGRYAQIGDAPVIVGRGIGVDLQISDPTVSRHHCVIWRASGRCWIRDLGSTNQTRVNNRPARIAELFEGDVILVGQTALTLALNAFW